MLPSIWPKLKFEEKKRPILKIFKGVKLKLKCNFLLYNILEVEDSNQGLVKEKIRTE